MSAPNYLTVIYPAYASSVLALYYLRRLVLKRVRSYHESEEQAVSAPVFISPVTCWLFVVQATVHSSIVHRLVYAVRQLVGTLSLQSIRRGMCDTLLLVFHVMGGTAKRQVEVVQSVGKGRNQGFQLFPAFFMEICGK